MIAALAFVPKGKAKEVPDRDVPAEAELEALREEALKSGALESKMDEDDDDDADAGWETESEEDEEAAIKQAEAMAASLTKSKASAQTSGSDQSASRLAAAMQKLDMDNYDNDDEGNLVAQILQGNNNEYDEEDPYITLQDNDSEIEDDNIKATDLLILAAKSEEDTATLEVWLLEEPEDDSELNAYVHHEIMLPAFPLSVAWMDYNPAGEEAAGSFVAVSTFDPEIEIWNLDVMDAMEPVAVLGGAKGGGRRSEAAKSSAGKKQGFKQGSHRDSVLSLAWNTMFRNVLASGSADLTVKVWDLATQQCEHTLKHHTGKVQVVCWNPVEAQVLLSGGFDARACILDLRSPGNAVAAWQLSKDVEALTWNPHNPTQFLAACEDGIVTACDARSGAGSKPLFTLSAHDKPTTSICFNPAVPNLLATGSTDKTVKLWDLSDNKPSLVCTEDLKAGAIFSMGFPSDSPHLLAAGGSKGSVFVWNIRQRAEVMKKYKRYFKS